MGWRTQDAYDEAAEDERGKLLWHRLSLARVAALVLILAIVSAPLWAKLL